MGALGAKWLGLVSEGDRWLLPVAPGVMSGASALFGGCATAAALVVAGEMTPHPIVWAAAHFGALAKVGTQASLAARTISAGRTMTHLEVVGSVDERESFCARVAGGARPQHPAEGQRVAPVLVPSPDEAQPFDHPVHAGTWAQRFEWRVAGRGTDGAGDWAAWWVRPSEPIDPDVCAAVLCDYVTYGVGRAIHSPMGGLSIDNVLRLHDRQGAEGVEWLQLEVRLEAAHRGIGHGAARLFAGSTLVASGSQSMVINDWDWRLPDERS